MNPSKPALQLSEADFADLAPLLDLAQTSFVQAFTEGNKPENVQAYLSQAFTSVQLEGVVGWLHQGQLGCCPNGRPRS